MQRLVLGVLVVSVDCILLWQFSERDPGASAVVFGLVIVLFNLVAGIRIGYESARAYADDVVRLNNHLIDQNSELVQCNYEMLERALPSEGGQSTPEGDLTG